MDLSTTYLGLPLRNPLVVSACPLTEQLETLRSLEEAGVAAVVLPSLFQEQIEHDEREAQRLMEYGTESFAEATTYFVELEDHNAGAEGYLRHVEEARKELSIPVIASLNGATPGGWTHYAAQMESAGASAIELNITFVPTDPELTAEALETRYVDLVAAVRAAVSLPLAVKIGPFFTSLPHLARRLVDAGADGLVLFNRLLDPDLDLETMCLQPTLTLSRPEECRLALRWIGILRDRVDVSLAATGGVHSAADLTKVIAAGAEVALVATVLLERGCAVARELLEGLEVWLVENEYRSVAQLRGSASRSNCPDPTAYERANYMRALTSFSGDLG